MSDLGDMIALYTARKLTAILFIVAVVFCVIGIAIGMFI